jgi:hypothetical protein
MIIYDLSCEQGHRFEGWFRSAEDFESQLERHFVRCPQCESSNVRRIPSAVAIVSSATEVNSGDNSLAVKGQGMAAAMMAADGQIRALYRQLVDAIVANTEDVGSSFADEARRIHYNEAPERPIRGQATPDEREALHDEGIDILHLPLLKDDDLN